MAILKGFPPAGTISPQVRIVEKDLSFISPQQSFHRAGLVGFASKGPINKATMVSTSRQLHTIFGYGHPDAGDPYLIYAAEQYLLVANELYVVRVADTSSVSDERAKTASVDVAVAGASIVLQSNTAGPYVFDVDSFFKWKLNGVDSVKTLLVPANTASNPSYTCAELVEELNSQLVTSIDGIEFSCSDDLELKVSTTFSYGPDATLELVSVQNSVYGAGVAAFVKTTASGSGSSSTTLVVADSTNFEAGDSITIDGVSATINTVNHTTDTITLSSTQTWGNGNVVKKATKSSGVSGLGSSMTQAETTSAAAGYSTGYEVDGTWDFTSATNLQLLVVVDGTDNVAIDNSVQVIDLEALEGGSNTTADIVNEINSQITNGTIVGGFYAVGGSSTDGPTIDGITIDLTAHPLYAADNVTLVTLHSGRDAKLLVKSESTAFSIFDFDGLTAKGVSPGGVTGDSNIEELAIITGSAVSSTNSLTITADSPGIEGNATQIVVKNDVRNATFQIDVYSNSVQVETHGPLTKDQTSRYYVETYLASNSDYITAIDNTAISAPPKNGTYALTGGTDGIPADPDLQDELIIGSEIGSTGLYALSDPEQIDIDLLAAPGHSSTSVVLGLINICENYRMDCLAIIDAPFGLSVNEIVKWQNGAHPLNSTRLDSDFAALYWPWVKIRDNFNRIDVWVPPSGSVMAVIARNDVLEAPWFAPAGTKRGQVPGITGVFSRPTLAERDLMLGNRNAINPIIQFNDTGYLVFGQKTMQRTPTALDRINVRRMLFLAEKRIKSASRQLLFDPNDETFQRDFIEIASGILREIQIGRGIYDYKIQADSSLNTADVIDRNEFRARIGIQPVRAAEFMFIEFSIHRSGSFAENTEVF
jgi:phage tail sheath protein FI